MKPLFDASLYQFDKPQPSYWEATAGDIKPLGEALEGAQSCDVAIIGGGYTGLSAALHLARDFNIDVAVLEAGHIGWGASGRNGGFCTMGATKLSLKSQIARFGIDQTRHFYQSQTDAVNLVRGLVCFAMNFRPSIGRMPENLSVYFGYGYHGNGVNSATWSGRELAYWLAGKHSSKDLLPQHLPAIMQGRSAKFPLAFLRRQYLRAGMGFYRLRDFFDI